MSERGPEPPGGADSWDDIDRMAEFAEKDPRDFQRYADAVDKDNERRREEAGGGLSGWDEY